MNVVAGRPAARGVAWSLAGLTVLTLAATLVLLGLDVRVISASRILFYMLGTLALVLCAGIGRRATPYEVLSGFADRLAGTYSTEEVLPQMARMLAEATGAERAEVWLRGGGAERLEAAWPQQATAHNPAELPAAAAESGPPPADPAVVGEPAREFAVEHHGDRLGTLWITCSPREPLTRPGNGWYATWPRRPAWCCAMWG